MIEFDLAVLGAATRPGGGETVKPGLHPNTVAARATCACGATYEVRSVKATQHLDVCGACHPFYTGKQRIVDTGGRVERFLKRYEQAKARAAARG